MIDLKGKRFGKLTVLKYAYTKNKRAFWLCKCDCGNTKIIEGHNLKMNNTRSCGCLAKNKKHGQINTKIYAVWQSLKKRCFNKSAQAFFDYGGRGITVCDEWKNSFLSFYTWSLDNGYKEGLSIDRINNNKGYSPENCRWVTQKEQNRNTRKTHFITYNNKTMCLADWATFLNITPACLIYRLKHWTLEKALTTNKNG